MQRDVRLTSEIKVNVNDKSSLKNYEEESDRFCDEAAKARKEAYKNGQNFHQKKTTEIIGNVIDLSKLSSSEAFDKIGLPHGNLSSYGQNTAPVEPQVNAVKIPVKQENNLSRITGDLANVAKSGRFDSLCIMAKLIIEDATGNTICIGDVNINDKVTTNGKATLSNEGYILINNVDTSAKDNVTATVDGKPYNGGAILIGKDGVQVINSTKSPTAHRKNSMFDLSPIVVDEEIFNDLKAVIDGEKSECEFDDPIIVDEEVFNSLKAEIGEDKSCHMCMRK